MIAIKTTVGTPHRTVGSFDIRGEKHTLSHVYAARRICGVGVMGVVGVVIVKATEQDLTFIRHIITIGVLQQIEVGAL